MKSFMKRIFGPGGSPGKDGPVEVFGRTSILRSRGEEILSATPKRKDLCQGIRDRIGYVAKSQKHDLVDRVLVRFALFVGDLPASERDHDSGSFGLLDHSLDIAHKVVKTLASSAFKPSPNPVASSRERPAWVYAGFLAALLHDVGKVLGIEVVRCEEGKPFGDPWNPRVQPLVGYLAARGIERAHPKHAKFIAGRGDRTHERMGSLLHALVLDPGVIHHAGAAYTHVVEAYVERSAKESPTHLPETAKMVASLIRQVDGGDRRKEDKSTGKKSNPEQGKPESKQASVDQAARSERTASASPPAKKPPAGPVGAAPPVAKPAAGGSSGGSGPNQRMDTRSEKLLEPAALLAALKGAIDSGALPRNSKSAQVLIRPDRVWVFFPHGFRELWKRVTSKSSQSYEERILQALSRSGEAFEQAPESPKAVIRTRPDSRHPRWAVGIRTGALFDDKTARDLGFWPYVVTPVALQSADEVLAEKVGVA